MFSRSSLRPALPRLAAAVSALLALSGCAAGAGGTSGAPTSPVSAASSREPQSLTRPTVATDPETAREPRSAAPSGTAVQAAPAAPEASAASAAADPRAAAVTSATVYGFSDPNLVNESASVQMRQLQQMKAFGVTSIRLDAGWAWVQPNGPGTYDWSALDQVISSIAKVGFSVDLIIDQCPSWAGVASAQGSVWAQPASAATFAKYAAAVAARYGHQGVKYFEIWNEPNIIYFWAPKPDPGAYSEDLKAAYSAIKEVDPAAFVLSGGLSPAVNTSTSFDPRTFLKDMYADGDQRSFDGLGDHPYSYPILPDNEESWSGWSQMSQTNPSLRSIMAENGDTSKKIWITEYGAPTTGSSSVGANGQTTELLQAIALARKSSWLGSLYIYTWADLASEPEVDNGFGMLTDNSVHKPAYAVVSAAMRSAQ